MLNFQLRKACSHDIPFLLDLRQVTMEHYLREVGMPTDRASYLERIRYHFDCAEIVWIEGCPTGLFKACFQSELQRWYVVQLQIHPDFQNQKIGSRLLGQLIGKARGYPVALHVVKTNPARRLYQHLGFNYMGESQFEYEMEYRGC
ncbi:MAG: hypothetical protein CENE_03460 [Candidatus Celerinatantimonas neptuna]|nr:MAG: hypothetical protein CENE_03460 [Candidatus Celerinatantimonas neptuna]